MIKKILVFVLIVLAVFAIDHLTKMVINRTLGLYESRNVIGDFFRLTHIRNEGVAFGIMSNVNLPYKNVIFFFVQMAALVSIMVYYFKSEKKPLLQVSFGLIVGGALGNIFDRLLFGEVIDFVDFGIGRHRWFTFNMADAAICVGVGLLILIMIREDKKCSP